MKPTPQPARGGQGNGMQKSIAASILPITGGASLVGWNLMFPDLQVPFEWAFALFVAGAIVSLFLLVRALWPDPIQQAAPPPTVTITSHGQSGGITAQNVTLAEDISLKRRLRELLKEVDGRLPRAIDAGELSLTTRMSVDQSDQLEAMRADVEFSSLVAGFDAGRTLEGNQISNGSYGPKEPVPQAVVRINFNPEVQNPK